MRSGYEASEDKALDNLCKRNRKRITSFTRRNNGSLEEAAELLQDCLVVLFFNVKKDGFQLTATLDSYLFAIARNLWLKQLRSKRRRVQLVDWPETLDLPAKDVPDALLNAGSSPILRLMDRLSIRCNEVLTMIYVRDLGIKDIKTQLGYASEQAVRNKKAECLTRLREAYQAQKLAMKDE
jgi:RNA polymerase sigma factor (sigma-70 family)